MKKQLLISTLLLGGAFLLPDLSMGHGGTYRGPGDTVPPGGGGGGSGGAGTPGPAAPTTPGGGTPSTPGTGGPRIPGSGGSGGGGIPTTGGSSSSADLTNWQFWWGFNKDPYLNLKSKLHSSTLTGSDDFYLGHGSEAEAKDSFRPSEATIRDRIVPALKHALATEKSNDILTGALVALAKIGDSKDIEGNSEFEQIISGFLSDSVQEVRETAAVALGILANSKSIDTLEHLALDDATGRELVGRKDEVHYRTRAFAVYGLGLVGYQANARDRERIVGTLAGIIDEDRMATRDVKVAALLALGLVPIEVMDAVPAPGEASNRIDPTRSRTNQINYLLDFLKNERNHYLVRAHAPRSVALLLKDAPEELREKTAGVLLEFVGKRARGHQKQLRESATLALGQIGNCDGDGVDARIHERLLQGMEDPDQQAKFYSLIALAQVTGRPGSLEAPHGEYDQRALKATRKHLATEMSRGSRAKTWAALSLGVLGHSLSEHGVVGMSPDLSLSIRMAMESVTNPDDVGAYALASGLRRDTDAIEGLRGKLSSISDDAARGDIAVGLGLMDARSAMKDIQLIVRKSKYRPDLLKQAAIALGLLGDKSTVPALTEMLRESKSLATQASISQALGFIGDSHSVDPLVELLEDSQVTPRARAFAAVALGIVADKESLPWNSKVSVDINYRANTSTLTGESGTGLLDIL